MGCTGSLNIPISVVKLVQGKFVGELGRAHSAGHISPISVHQQNRISQLVRFQEGQQFITSVRHTLSVARVDNEDDAVDIAVIYSLSQNRGSDSVRYLTMTPEWPYFILPSNVPNLEVNFSKCDFLNIEAYSNEILGAEGSLPIVGIV